MQNHGTYGLGRVNIQVLKNLRRLNCIATVIDFEMR